MTKEEFEEWLHCNQQLNSLKKREMELRKKLANEISSGKIGTTTEQLFGYTVKSSLTESVSLAIKPDKLNEIWNELSPEEKECIVNKPTLDKRKYDRLPVTSILYRNYVTRKVNAPTLKAEPIEEK